MLFINVFRISFKIYLPILIKNGIVIVNAGDGNFTRRFFGTYRVSVPKIFSPYLGVLSANIIFC